MVAIRAVALAMRGHSGSAGVVIDPGAAPGRLKAGDRIALGPVSDRNKRYLLTVRECLVSQKACFPIATDITLEQAAAIASAHTFAWPLLMALARVKPGEIVLVVGLSDPIAVAALQLAVQLGARVMAASDDENHLTAARAMGAEQCINSAEGNLPQAVRSVTAKHGADVAVNCLGGESWGRSLACLARGGRLVTAGARDGALPQTDLRRIFWNHLQVLGNSQGNQSDFDQVLSWFQTTGAQPVIDSVFPLRQEKAAQRRFQSGAAFGSVIVSNQLCG